MPVAHEIAARRSSLWWLLARLVIEQPTQPWLDELAKVLAAVDPGPATPLGPESAALLDALRTAQLEPDGLTALTVDRTRLLAGVLQNDNLPAPYESAAMGEPMNGERVAQVIAAYREAGFDEFAPELGPEDFLGTELRFMALLCFQEMLARRQGDDGLAAQWLERQRSFLDHHVMDWVPVHCERLRHRAITGLYAASFGLIAQACRIDRADIDQLSQSGITGHGAFSEHRSESML